MGSFVTVFFEAEERRSVGAGQKNRPIDAGSRRNRANFESPKFPYQFKSMIF
jgi:hypothetical protein